MPPYADSEVVREARAEYFRRSSFAPDGGYADKWVRLKVARFALLFPNTAARVRSVKLHDIHHVLTEYDTSWRGEAEIAAWEIASGCGKHYPAWLLNFGALAIGMALAPRRVFHAFVRGRRSDNLYAGEFSDDLLTETVGELRSRLHVPESSPPASANDWLAFLTWLAISISVSVLPYVCAIGAILLIWRRL
jgi:hypothetical protein